MKTNAIEIKSVYAVCGKDSFRKSEAIKGICDALAKHHESDEPPTRYDGAKCELASVLDDVRTYSLLGGIRIVIVEGADPFITRHRATLEKYCAEPVDSGVLILECTSLASNTRIYKAIAKSGQIIKCDPLKGQAILAWVNQHARTVFDKQLDQQAAWRLRDLVGSSLGALDAELGKLSIFVGSRPTITSKDVDELVGRLREEDIFGITDAIASGDTASALEQWERVLATDRAAPARAVGGLAWGFRKLLDLKLQQESGVPIGVLARQAYTRPDILQRRLGRHDVADLQNKTTALLEADLASKNGLSNAATAVQKFIVSQSA
ncbi:MAG: DNA polymerase III subunit delta [Planctomycetes bacterium]|nr:DNA polymerase III subunit delta [Planctomycetota bacterium]